MRNIGSFTYLEESVDAGFVQHRRAVAAQLGAVLAGHMRAETALFCFRQCGVRGVGGVDGAHGGLSQHRALHQLAELFRGQESSNKKVGRELT